MSLRLEVFGPNKQWIDIAVLKPGALPGSMSDNKPDGSRDVYMFECLPDNSKSIIYRSKRGIDVEIGKERIITTADVEIVRELTNGDASYEMIVNTDRKTRESRLMRFTHI